MILDDFSAGSVDFVPTDVLTERIDIHDWKKVEAAFARFGPEAVFHLAAQIDIRSEFPDAKRYATDSMNVLEWSRHFGVKKFVFSSSAAVYGDNKNLPVAETEPMSPASPYGLSKLNFERHLLSEHRAPAMQTVVLRYANVYGPRQGAAGEGGVAAVFCKKLLANEPLTIFGSGEQTRDFTFVSDVVESNVLAMQAAKDGVVYNVSTTAETSVNTLAEKLLKISGKNMEIKHVGAVAGDVARSALDNSLIKKELGWSPKVLLENGLVKTWNWFENNVKVQSPNVKSMSKS